MEAGHKKGKFVAYGGLYHSRTDGSGVNNYLNVPSIVPVDPNTSKSSEYSLNGGPIVQPGVAKKGEYEYRATTSFEQYATQAEKYFNSKMRSDVSEAFSRLADDLRKYTAGKGSEGRALLKPVHSLKEMTQDSRLDQMVLSQMIKELSS
jgi:hypothetical protein